MFFAQEMYVTEDTSPLWECEWGEKAFFAPGTSNSRGVGIFIRNKLNCKVLDSIKDKLGRFVMVTIEIEEKIILLVNLYAPNSDSPDFYEMVTSIVDKCAVNEVIMGGDYNLVLDKELDSKNRKTNNDKAAKVVIDFMSSFGLVDPWRIYNPECKRYTCYKRRTRTYARLDYILITPGLLQDVNEVDIHPCTISDHNMVDIALSLDHVKRGPGLWRLNTRLLLDEDMVTHARGLIRMCIIQNRLLGARESWELIKMKIKKFLQQEGVKKAAETKNERKALMEIYDDLCNELEIDCIVDTCKEVDMMSIIKQRINCIDDVKAEGAILRSRVKWAEEGEKNTNYFLAIEKRNYNAKLMKKLYINGNLCTEQEGIMQAQKQFYETLYTQDRALPFNIDNTTGIGLNEVQRDRLDGDITIEECYQAMNSMSKGKAPGMDGLPVEFYATFWNDIKDILLRVYIESFEDDLLNYSARQGVISLLPKGTKDPLYLKNWRPLTLLNLDYKILSKVLALRMKSVLSKIIGAQQTGFMEGRQISENIRKTMDVIAHVAKNDRKNKVKKGYVIMTIDFEKCFDLISHNAVKGAMQYFKFGEQYIKWVSLFFNRFMVCTQNAGHLSESFIKTRSVNQGCCISPYLYLLCGEIMSHLIKNHPNIKGIPLEEVMMVISQFADDTTLFLEFDQLTLESVVEVLTHVETQMGLKVSYEKTTIYRIGSLRNSEAMLYTTKPFQWSSGDIDMLGVKIQNNNEGCQTCGAYDTVIDKIAAIKNTWKARKLTLMGKIIVVNALMASLLVYKLTVFPNMSAQQCKILKKHVMEFLWGKAPAKVPMQVLCAPKRLGGQKLMNIHVKQASLKASWVKHIVQSNS